MDLETFLKIAGVVLTVVGLFFAGYQIRETNKTLVFTTEQGLYKESRDILKFIADNPSIFQAAQVEDISNLDAKERVKLSGQIGILLNFYNSILIHKSAEYISTEFRNRVVQDFCLVAKLPQVNKRLPTKPEQPYQELGNIARSSCHG